MGLHAGIVLSGTDLVEIVTEIYGQSTGYASTTIGDRLKHLARHEAWVEEVLCYIAGVMVSA